jgi:dolichol-phosphate mannosyltransferase
MTRALLTGASGFVGANLARRLLRDGVEVHLLLRSGHDPRRLRDIADLVIRHDADLANAADVSRVMTASRPDAVFHLAAYGAYSQQRDFQQMVATNVLGTSYLVDAAVAAGVGAFIHTGSSSEYGWKQSAAREDDRLEPGSHYAITKAAATHYCRHAAVTHDIHAVTLRLYSIYGPWETPTRLFPTLLTHVLRGEWPPLVAPSAAHDFVYVDDAVDAMVAVASATQLPRGAIYNVCSGVQTTLGELVAAVRELAPVAAEPQWSTMPPRAWDTDRWVGSGDALLRDLGWRPATSLRSGIEQTLAWMRQAPWT